MIKNIILLLTICIIPSMAIAQPRYAITNSSVDKSKIRITGYKNLNNNSQNNTQNNVQQQAVNPPNGRTPLNVGSNRQPVNTIGGRTAINNVPKSNTNNYGTYSAPSKQAFKRNVLITNDMGVDKPKKEFNISKISGLADACKNVILAQNGSRYNDLGYGLCFGYIRGVKNYYDISKGTSGYGKICFPKSVTWLQIIKVYMKWVDEHPEKLHKTAWEGVIYSMTSAFNCGINQRL